jgi:ribonuclease J
MRICIHRGATEIGGTCIEVISQDKRIVLDIGSPLEGDPFEVPLYPIAGFHQPDASLLGVVISHPHQDHYGLAARLPKETPFLLGEAAENILAAAAEISPAGIRLEHTQHLVDRKPIQLGPFTLTPFLMDHSGYDSYALLVQADGKSIFYTGDLRAHGRKAKLFERLLKRPPENVDILLMEGTTVGRNHADAPYPTEDELETQFLNIFKATPGMPLVWCAGQNIDRIVTIYRACKKAGRQLIVDLYVAEILRATGNTNIPQAHWPGVRVYMPYRQRVQVVRAKNFHISAQYKDARIYPENLRSEAARSVMLFRPGMMRDLEEAECLDDAKLVYSLWPGYLERDDQQPLKAWLKQQQIPLTHCHTSGHASVTDLKRLRNAMSNATVVPIHSQQAEAYAEFFGNVVQRKDGELWEVC